MLSLRRRLVPRQRLLGALANWRTYRVVRVVAPAGFGKSTFGAMWLHTLHALPEGERPLTAWLPLTTADAALDVFVDRLAGALADDLPHLQAVARLVAAGEMALPQIVRAFVSELSTLRQPLILAFDDLHLVSDGPSLNLLQNLLAHDELPIHFLLLSRTRLTLDLSRQQLDEKVLSFNVDDLIFDKQEFAAFAQMHQLTELTSAQLSFLEQHAGGWAAGLQLIVQSLPTTRSLPTEVLHITSGDADLWSYIETALFARANDHISLMVDTALLPVLSADLCAAVTGRPAAECTAILEDITTINSLVTSHIASSGSRRADLYRVHPVLRDFLLRRLLRTTPHDAIHAARRRAAECLVRRGNVDIALTLLLEDSEHSLLALSPDADFAADLLQPICRTATFRGEILSVRRWLDKLPEAAVRARPTLAVAAAWCAFHLMDNRLSTHIRRAAESIQPGEQGDEMRAELTLLRALACVHAGNLSEASHHMHAAWNIPHPPDGITAGYLHTIRGYLMFGEIRTLEERRRDLHIGYEILTRNEYLRGRIEALVCDQWVCTSYGAPGAALAAGERAQQLITASGVETSSFGMYSLLYYSHDLYLLDHISDARIGYQRFIDLSSSTGVANVPTYHARLRLQLCDLADGQASLVNFDPVADATQWAQAVANSSPIIAANTAYMRIIRDDRLGRSAQLSETMQVMGRSVETLDANESQTIWLPALLCSVLTGDNDAAVTTNLAELRRRCESIQQSGLLLFVQIIQVLHMEAQGCVQEAVAELRLLLTTVERTGYVRIILDLSHRLNSLLLRINTPFAEELLQRGKSTLHNASFDLSPTELRVLQYLAGTLSTTAIAAEMFISVTTVRTHVRSIYRKMRVNARKAAVIVARNAGLVN